MRSYLESNTITNDNHTYRRPHHASSVMSPLFLKLAAITTVL